MRGWGPVDALGAAFPGDVRVEWDIQPLGGFESRPLKELTEIFDLLVIDHTHTGEAAESGLLLPIGDLPDEYVASCRESYFWKGRYWAVPIDAACQVSAVKGIEPVGGLSWEKILERAADEAMTIPLKGVHSLMALMTLLASAGHPVDAEKGFPDPDVLTSNLQLLGDLSRAAVAESLSWNPIEALEALAEGRVAMIPLTFGYASFVERGIRFGATPESGLGAVLGGTGMAVSAQTAHPEEAIALARYAGSAEVQSDLWFAHGGQPAHRLAWDKLAAGEPFYGNTYSTLQASYLRPRFPGWNRLQSLLGTTIENWLRADGADSPGFARQLRDLWDHHG